MRGVLRFALRLVAVVVVCGAGFATYASWRYHRVPRAERACEGCQTPVSIGDYILDYHDTRHPDTLPPVILVHGGPGHSALSFKNGFDFLAGERRVVMYDQRGSGRSQSRDRAGDYSVDNLVEELESLRREVVRADRVVLVGHSFGAAIVQRYAIAYPAHVDRMALVGGVRLNNGTPNHLLWRLVGPMLWSTVLGLPPATSDAADDWFNRVPDSTRLFEPARTDLLKETGVVRFATWRDVSMSASGPAREEELRALQMPVSFFYGAADSPYTSKPVGDYLCGLVPHCRNVEFARSGHWPFLEEPDAFAKAFRDFLTWTPAN